MYLFANCYRLCERLSDPLDRRAHIPQAARATRIAHFARATAGVDVRFYAFDSFRCPIDFDLRANA